MSMSGTVGGSSVNPNAPLSVLMLLQQVRSLQALVEHWLHQLRELEIAGEDMFETDSVEVEHWLHQLRELEIAGEDMFETDSVEALVMNLSAKSPKKGTRPRLFPGKYRDKPVRCIHPKCSPRRIIHQPR
ncbi:uncharacterized protein LOC141830054 [Curcuma longa]|uniref:uncharacterized protein LOC141830054 n=1 Tax=Curcuma longa TaxID=136217 RepID=UPI003D9E1D68